MERNSGIDEPDYLHSAERVASQRARLTGANKRMLNLLRKAKVQLIKIDQQKQLKSSGVSALRVNTAGITYDKGFQNHLTFLFFPLTSCSWPQLAPGLET